jgi:hypothetical protein
MHCVLASNSGGRFGVVYTLNWPLGYGPRWTEVISLEVSPPEKISITCISEDNSQNSSVSKETDLWAG